MPPTYRLPIFPLSLVLLPRASQALHIFEPRYRQLLADCLASTKEFGIIYHTSDIAEREIASGIAGCVAHIESSQPLPDGRSNVLVTGTSRFSLVDLIDASRPYLVARVAPLEDEPDAPHDMAELVTRLRELFVRVAQSARSLQDDDTPLPVLPDSATELAFSIASHLDLDAEEKQRLLASRSALERLRQLDDALSPIVEIIETRSQIHTRARTNGHGTHE